jgi:poly [ADP-ribose] polymerase
MIQLNESTFKVEFGRIGSGFQEASYPIGQWDKKYKEKLKKGYSDNTRFVAESSVKITKNKEYIDIKNAAIASIVNRLQAMAKQAIADNYTISASNSSHD